MIRSNDSKFCGIRHAIDCPGGPLCYCGVHSVKNNVHMIAPKQNPTVDGNQRCSCRSVLAVAQQSNVR